MGMRFDSPFGYDLNYYTVRPLFSTQTPNFPKPVPYLSTSLVFQHWSLAATLILIIVFGITTVISRVLWGFGNNPRECYANPVEVVTCGAITSALSIQLFLTLATLGMLSGASPLPRPCSRVPVFPFLF